MGVPVNLSPAKYSRLKRALAASQLVRVSISSSGDVTSVALSMPAEFVVTGSPGIDEVILGVTSAVEAANTVWAGPVSGVAATPGFRALVAADLPASGNFAVNFTDNEMISGSGTAWTFLNAPNPTTSVHLYVLQYPGGPYVRLPPSSITSITGMSMVTAASWTANTLLADYTWHSALSNFADNEILIGSGTAWTFLNAPNLLSSVDLYVAEYAGGPFVRLPPSAIVSITGTAMVTASPWSAGALLAD